MAQETTKLLNLSRYEFRYLAGIRENKLAILLNKNISKVIDLLPEYLRVLF